MVWLSRLETRWGRWAIPNATALIIAGQAALYVMNGMRGDEFRELALHKIALKPPNILHGEVWRLVSFVFYPPQCRPLWALFGWMLFYMFGASLERLWGSFRYNVYLLAGYVANVAAAFVAWWVWELDSPMEAQAAKMSEAFGHTTNALLFIGVFLAFARRFPDTIINLFFIFPIQIKWLGLLAWIGWFYSFARHDGPSRLLLLASIANYLLFFGREHWSNLRQARRRHAFEQSVERGRPRHRCLVCGLNSADSPRTLFRYCSQCSGQKCYCPEHIANHAHQ